MQVPSGSTGGSTDKALHGTFLGPPHTVRPVGLGPGGPKKVPRINKVPCIAINIIYSKNINLFKQELRVFGLKNTKVLLLT